MASLKKKAATKTTGKKKAASKVKAQKKTAAKKAVSRMATSDKPVIKKGSKLACEICGFAFTVDHLSNSVEEADLICCEVPMKLKRRAAKKKAAKS
jgi:hypothetical protein